MAGSADDSSSMGVTAHYSRPAFLAIIWLFFALASGFLSSRIWIKARNDKRQSVDDWFLYLGYTALLANAVLQTLQVPSLYWVVEHADKVEQDLPHFKHHGLLQAKLEFAIMGLFFTVLWCVKAAFLALFWRLFQGLHRERRWLAAACIFTALGYIGAWLSSIFTCHPVPAYFQFGQCFKPEDQLNAVISTVYVAVIDVVTDIIIIIFALRIVSKIRRSQRDKFGLGIALSLTAVTIVIAIARACEISGRTFRDPIRLALWGVVESSIAVIVGCLPAFRIIFTQHRRKQELPAPEMAHQSQTQANSTDLEPPSTVRS